TELDFVNHVGLAVGILEHGSEIPVGVGRYILESRSNKKPDCAELAFAVEETFQNQGVGTLLLKHLAVIARQSGLKYFSANVLGDNAKMCAVLAHSPLFVRVVNCGEGIRRFVLKLK
ncbi:MAG TPA: GNAT family N-acetyltransferase, partial [Chroococcales cyanobacterium]